MGRDLECEAACILGVLLGDDRTVRVLYIGGYKTRWVLTHRMAGLLYALTAEIPGQLEIWVSSWSLSKTAAFQRKHIHRCFQFFFPTARLGVGFQSLCA